MSFYNKNSGYGLADMIRVNLSLPTMGKLLVVMPSTDANYGRFAEIVNTDPDGVVRLYTTVNSAYTAATTNSHDIIALSANSGHAVDTAGLVITKSRIHFVGLDGSNRRYGLRTRITGAAGVTEVGIMKNTGVGNTFKNIKFDSASTVAASIYAVAEGGEYSEYENVEFYKSTDLDGDGAAELLQNGDSARYKNCTFGSLVNAITATGARPCVLVSRETITGKVCRDTEFVDCLFWRKCAGGTGNAFVYGANATDVERILLFERCVFVNAKLATQTPAQNILFGANQTEGYILVKDCTSVGAATAVSTNTSCFIDSPLPDTSKSGISLVTT